MVSPSDRPSERRPDPPPPEARIGTTLLGKWTLERLIGKGGMAAVYEGAHRIGRRDAIKILHPDVASVPDLRARFEREAAAANRFQHPGAVEVRDFDVAEDGSPFIVMELLEGETLAERVRREGIAFDDLLRFTEELLDVLGAAHAVGIVHRDIKPDNVFLARTPEGERVKVLDFGIARVLELGPRTAEGTRLGTVAFMPPEQVRGAEIDARADVFAVGATLFRILARRRVHEAATEAALIRRMATEPAPRLGDVAPDVPRPVALVVDRALAFDRDERYPDARTMQLDVAAVRRGDPPPFAAARRADEPPSGGARPPLASAPDAGLAFEPTVPRAAAARVEAPEIEARPADRTEVSAGGTEGLRRPGSGGTGVGEEPHGREAPSIAVVSAPSRPAPARAAARPEPTEPQPPSEPPSEPGVPLGVAAVTPPALRLELLIGAGLVAAAALCVGYWLFKPAPPVAAPTALAPIAASAPARPPPARSAARRPPEATVARSAASAPPPPPTLMPTVSPSR